MIYEGMTTDEKHHCFIAVSDDGIHFKPEDVSASVELENRVAPNELFVIELAEIAEIIEDKKNNPEERYKMLYTKIEPETFSVHGLVLASPDLIHWKKLDVPEWNCGAEPITGAFYNKEKECFTINVRPDWGIRKVGRMETKDWKSYSDYEVVMQSDSIDDPLCEIYGMPAFEYKGYYIGLPIMYRNFEDDLSAKYFRGTIDSELAYSYDGRNWQRSLREPYLSGLNDRAEEVYGNRQNMLWPASFVKQDNGDLLIFTSSCKMEHGFFNTEAKDGVICAYRVKEDRFIGMFADKEGLLATRENIWNSGEVRVNLKCKSATIAVYESTGDDNLGRAKPVEGYTHEDCIEFSGDTTDWVPKFKNGNTLDALKGRTIVIEVKINEGAIYSIEGDFLPVKNLPASRYRTLGIRPDKLV